MLGGRDLKGRALDQPAHVLAGEPTDFDAKALGLGVEYRPVGEASGRRVEEPEQAQRGELWWTSSPASAAISLP